MKLFNMMKLYVDPDSARNIERSMENHMSVFIYLESTLREHTEHTHTHSSIIAVDSHALIPKAYSSIYRVQIQ